MTFPRHSPSYPPNGLEIKVVLLFLGITRDKGGTKIFYMLMRNNISKVKKGGFEDSMAMIVLANNSKNVNLYNVILYSVLLFEVFYS